MMSGHGSNPIFFDKKDKDWMSRTLAYPPSLSSNNIPFLFYPPPGPFKEDIICVSALMNQDRPKP